jgi:hypothetical protein
MQNLLLATKCNISPSGPNKFLNKNCAVDRALPGKPWERERNYAFVVSSISSLRHWQTPPPTLVQEMKSAIKLH